jgi:hypothetical protein
MKITLEIVRQVLKESLGFDSFTAAFISSTAEDPGHPSAGITKDGELSYNPEFVNQFIVCNEDLFSLIFHELLHPMFNHFIYKSGLVENLAADAIINAVISNVYSGESRGGNLFKTLYREKGVEGLLRPQSSLSNSRFKKVYDRLYHEGDSRDKMTTGELIITLKILLESQEIGKIVLLGSHGEDNDSGIEWPKDILEKIADDMKRATLEKLSEMPGYYDTLMDMFLEALRTHLSIKRKILERFATLRKLDKFKELFHHHRMCSSPIPLYPSKRDLVLLASGFHPGFFHNKTTTFTKKDKGLAIYLDVSGSVNDYLPKILGILQGLRRDINSIFLFSNQVYEVPFESLLKGNIRTTGGTDFDCIAKSIIEKKFDKAIIITDGYASMKEENSEKLKKQKLSTLTILFDRVNTCEDFEVFGDVVQLEEICI